MKIPQKISRDRVQLGDPRRFMIVTGTTARDFRVQKMLFLLRRGRPILRFPIGRKMPI